MAPRERDEADAVADELLRRLSQAAPESLARALLPDAEGLVVHGWPDTQLAQRQRRLDRVLEVTAAGVRRLLHVEWQWRWERSVPWRVCEYQYLLASAHREAQRVLPVQSVVVLLSGRARAWPARGRYRLSPRSEPFSGVRFGIEAVYQRTVEELLARPGVLWPLFAPLALDAQAEKMPRALEALRERAGEHARFEDFAAAMAVLAERDARGRGLGDAVLSLLPREVLMNNTIYNLGREAGRAEGEAKGKAEGEAKGKAEGKAEDILVVLRARGVRVSGAQRARIAGERDRATLGRWLLRALEVTAARELFEEAPARRG